jgi:hypothetical protein
MIERGRVAIAGGGRVLLSRRESRVKETRFSASKLDIRVADRAQSALRAGRGAVSRTHLSHSVGHLLSESIHRGSAHRCQERVAVGEMTVGGIRNNPNQARHLAEDNRVRAGRARELETSRDERSAHRSARAGSATPGGTCWPALGFRLS